MHKRNRAPRRKIHYPFRVIKSRKSYQRQALGGCRRMSLNK